MQPIMSGERIPVRVLDSSGRADTGEVFLQRWNKKERMRRALKALVFGWLGGAVLVFVPLIHFFAVPLLILGTPFFALWTYLRESIVLGGRARCPGCGKDLPLVRSPDRWPLKDTCGACFTPVSVEKA